MSASRTSDAEGYVEDIAYTYGYQPDLDPRRMVDALRAAGLEPPRVARACELGFGQGVSLAIHAVAGGADWHGTDLNPSHVATLRALLAGIDASVEVAGQTFGDFFARDDLPQFDFIGAHGVWSWVSAANRARILRFLQRRLRPGGVFYLSYNALPGWAPMLPLRAMLMRSIAAADPQAPLAERIDEALRDVAMRILRDASFEEAHPGIGAELRAIRGKRAAYLAHEFFNRDWAPMHPDEVASMLSSAGLRFATLAAEGGERFRREYWVMGQPQRAEGGAAGESTLDATAMAMTDAVIERRRAGCRLLNARLLALALESPDPAWLASPVTGGGVEVGHTGLLLIEAHRRGLREPVALSRAVQETLSRLGQRLVRNGTVIVERDQSGAVLEEEARVMLGSGLPRLTALGALPLVA